MFAMVLALMVGQATTEVRISVSVVKPTCVVVDAAGVAKVVPRRSIKADERATGCTTQPAGAPRIEQQVEIAATADAPEQRLVVITY